MAENPKLVAARQWSNAAKTLISLEDAERARRTANAEIEEAKKLFSTLLDATKVIVYTDDNGQEWAIVEESIGGHVNRRLVERLKE